MISVAAAPVKASWLMRKRGKYLNFLKKIRKII